MKKRALVAALCCLSTASATAVAAPVATAQTATANKTMADQYQPTFTEPQNPFGANGDVETLGINNVPQGTKLTIINPNFGDGEGREQDELLVKVYGNSIWLHLFSQYKDLKKSISNTVKFLVEYPDGSAELIDHTFTVHPVEKLLYFPFFENLVVPVGETSQLKVVGMPDSASVDLIGGPEGWNVKQEGNTFTVTPPAEGNGEFVYKVTFSDGTSKIATSNVWADKDPKNADNPVRPGNNDSSALAPSESENPVAPGDDSGAPQGWIVGPSDHGNTGGSSTAGIIAGVIGAVLAIALSIGGAAFAGLIPGLKLPF